MNLDLVVLESDPIRSKLITLKIFKELVGLGVSKVEVSIPVVPIGLLSQAYKIITYSPMVMPVARYAERSGLVFNNVYGIVQTKLLNLVPDAETWCTEAMLLSDPQMIGRWLSWGLDFGAIDKSDINAYITKNRMAQYAVDTIDIEDVKRTLEALKA